MSGYTPLFSSLTTGTLCGRWPDIGLWPIVLSLADKAGVADVTPMYLSQVTGLPAADVDACMKRFCGPDPYSGEIRLTVVPGCGWRVSNLEYLQFNKRPASNEWREIRERIFTRDDFTCQYCGVRGVRLECDHVIPVSRGGSHDDENLKTACFSCNRSKRAKTLDEWLS